jgi:hypothetical protein
MPRNYEKYGRRQDILATKERSTRYLMNFAFQRIVKKANPLQKRELLHGTVHEVNLTRQQVESVKNDIPGLATSVLGHTWLGAMKDIFLHTSEQGRIIRNQTDGWDFYWIVIGDVDSHDPMKRFEISTLHYDAFDGDLLSMSGPFILLQDFPLNKHTDVPIIHLVTNIYTSFRGNDYAMPPFTSR